jgi:hypothetical protein
MGGACSMHGKGEKCVDSLDLRIWNKDNVLRSKRRWEDST